MAEQEGVIRFAYNLEPPTEAVASSERIAELNAWRGILRSLAVMGQDPQRYGGLGFGNLSARSAHGATDFLISASQTGAKPELQAQDLVRITDWNLERFWVDAQGHQPPSSETLTHAMIYAADSRIDWIMHGHDPHIWGLHETLSVPATPAGIEYGSRAMTHAVANLLEAHQSRPVVFVTLGHTDGVFSCGPTARDTGGLLVSYLAKALTIEGNQNAERDPD